MKTLIFQGVPYNVNDTNQVFLYTKSMHVVGVSATAEETATQVGTYDPSTGSITLFSDWQERAVLFLTRYRETLRGNTEEALEKARILQVS